MLIYAVADIHGKPVNFARIESNLALARPDVLVVAGDLTGFRESKKIVSKINRFGVPAFCVRGNTDWPAVDRLLAAYPGTHSLNLCEQMIDGIHIAGAGGTIPLPFRSRIRFSEHGVFKKLAPLIKPETILVVHPPPYGILDRALGKYHVGSRNLRRFLNQTQPRLLICGHVHEDSGIDMIGRTQVVNCAMSKSCAGALIEVNKSGIAGIEVINSKQRSIF